MGSPSRSEWARKPVRAMTDASSDLTSALAVNRSSLKSGSVSQGTCSPGNVKLVESLGGASPSAQTLQFRLAATHNVGLIEPAVIGPMVDVEAVAGLGASEALRFCGLTSPPKRGVGRQAAVLARCHRSTCRQATCPFLFSRCFFES